MRKKDGSGRTTMAKAVKTYRKSRTKQKTEHTGSHYFNDAAKPYSVGSTDSALKYKPKPRAATFGGTKNSKPVTKRVRRAKA